MAGEAGAGVRTCYTGCMEIRELIREYLSYLRIERGASPLTVKGYEHDLALYEQHLADAGVTELAEVDRAAVLGFEIGRAHV